MSQPCRVQLKNTVSLGIFKLQNSSNCKRMVRRIKSEGSIQKFRMPLSDEYDSFNFSHSDNLIYSANLVITNNLCFIVIKCSLFTTVFSQSTCFDVLLYWIVSGIQLSLTALTHASTSLHLTTFEQPINARTMTITETNNCRRATNNPTNMR